MNRERNDEEERATTRSSSQAIFVQVLRHYSALDSNVLFRPSFKPDSLKNLPAYIHDMLTLLETYNENLEDELKSLQQDKLNLIKRVFTGFSNYKLIVFMLNLEEEFALDFMEVHSTLGNASCFAYFKTKLETVYQDYRQIISYFIEIRKRVLDIELTPAAIFLNFFFTLKLLTLKAIDFYLTEATLLNNSLEKINYFLIEMLKSINFVSQESLLLAQMLFRNKQADYQEYYDTFLCFVGHLKETLIQKYLVSNNYCILLSHMFSGILASVKLETNEQVIASVCQSFPELSSSVMEFIANKHRNFTLPETAAYEAYHNFLINNSSTSSAASTTGTDDKAGSYWNNPDKKGVFEKGSTDLKSKEQGVLVNSEGRSALEYKQADLKEGLNEEDVLATKELLFVDVRANCIESLFYLLEMVKEINTEEILGFESKERIAIMSRMVVDSLLGFIDLTLLFLASRKEYVMEELSFCCVMQLLLEIQVMFSSVGVQIESTEYNIKSEDSKEKDLVSEAACLLKRRMKTLLDYLFELAKEKKRKVGVRLELTRSDLTQKKKLISEFTLKNEGYFKDLVYLIQRGSGEKEKSSMSKNMTMNMNDKETEFNVRETNSVSDYKRKTVLKEEDDIDNNRRDFQSIHREQNQAFQNNKTNSTIQESRGNQYNDSYQTKKALLDEEDDYL